MSRVIAVTSNLDALRQRFGLDWIKEVDPPRWMHASQPDRRYGQQEFYSPEIEWSVGGKRHRYAIPVMLRFREIWIDRLIWWRTVAEFDHPAMADDLAAAIRSTVR